MIDLSQDRVTEVIHVFESSITLFSPEQPFAYMVNLVQGFNAIDYALQNYWRSEIESLVRRDWRYVPETGMLYVDDFYSPVLTLEVMKNIQSIQDITEEGSLSWCLKYALALSRRTIGLSRRKFNFQQGPLQTDGNEMVSEAEQLINELEQNLGKDGQSGFFYILR